MAIKRIDVLKKHSRAVEDLVQIGVLDPRVLSMIDLYRARRVLGYSNKEAMSTFKCSERTVTRHIRFLETEL